MAAVAAGLAAEKSATPGEVVQLSECSANGKQPAQEALRTV
jgi:hypothetical protein